MLTHFYFLTRNLSLVIVLSALIISEALAAAGGIPGAPPPNANQCKSGWTLVAGASALAFGDFAVEASDTLMMDNTGGITAAGTTHLFATSPVTTFTVTLDNTVGPTCSTLNSTISATLTPAALTGPATMALTLKVSEPTAAPSGVALAAPLVLPDATLPITLTFHGDLTATAPQLAGLYSSAITIDFTDTLGTLLTVGGTATATSIQPIVLTQVAPMNFGAFAPDAAGDTVSLTNVATTVRNITTGVLLGGTVSSGQFTITGALGKTVGITVTDGAADLVNGASTLVFIPTAASLGATHVITGVPATDTLYVGGTITIPAAAAAGPYTSANAYTVTVNYN